MNSCSARLGRSQKTDSAPKVKWLTVPLKLPIIMIKALDCYSLDVDSCGAAFLELNKKNKQINGYPGAKLKWY